MTTTISVMATPLADENGVVTVLSGRVVEDARERLQDLVEEDAATADDPVDTGASASRGAEADESTSSVVSA